MPDTNRILALDLATKTGFAHTDGTSGVYTLPAKRDDEHNGFRFYSFATWLADSLDAHKVDAIVYELAHHRGGDATRLAVGLVTIVQLVAAYSGIRRVRGYHTATLKKHATGDGRAKKPAMAAAAKERHPTIELIDDNHVDALWLLDLALNDLP